MLRVSEMYVIVTWEWKSQRFSWSDPKCKETIHLTHPV